MEQLLEKLLEAVARSKMAFFVGRNDTGKSTLIRHIAGGMDVSIIDSDIGQSDIGPPSVVALGERHGGRYVMVDGYFCGSTSPARHFLPLIAGSARMAERVKRYPVLVNTTGLATGVVGRALKTEKINALAPDLIIGIGGGLEYLDAFGNAGATVVHLPVSPAVKPKSRSERTAMRQKAFGEHFRNAHNITYPFKGFSVERLLLFNGRQPLITNDVLRLDVSGNEALVVISGKRSDAKALMDKLSLDVLHVYTPEDFVNALVGLLDDHGRFLGLGIIEAMDFAEEKIHIYTAVGPFSVLQFGSIKLDMKDYHYMGPFSGHTLRA
jgi:polynucleotide 5'-hydroxyl-kinase GRC3/NOL9